MSTMRKHTQAWKQRVAAIAAGALVIGGGAATLAGAQTSSDTETEAETLDSDSDTGGADTLDTDSDTDSADTEDTDDSDDLTEGGSGSDTTTSRGDSGGGVASSSGADNLAHDLLLEDADLVRLDLDDDADEYVQLRFSDDIQDIEDETGFFLQGANPAQVVESTDAVLDEEDRSAVIVSFPADTDVRSFALAGAESGAVSTIEDEVNLLSTTALDAPANNSITGPELLSVRERQSLNWVIYEFDEQLDEDNASADRFGFYTEDGRYHDGDEVEAIDDGTVTIRFDESDGDRVNEAVRYVVEADAVQDTSGDANAISVLGSNTVSPDLEGARFVGDTSIELEFDETVTDIDPAAVFATGSDGERYAGEHYAIDEDGRTVTVVFPEIDDFSDEITRVSVEPDAGSRNGRSGDAVTVGAVQLADLSSDSGSTVGPDLESADIDESTGFVTLEFDEVIDDDVDYDAGAFHLVSNSGHLTSGDFIVEVTDDFVIVAFDENAAQAATTLTIDSGAVQDFSGTPSPSATLRR
jgi:hypothetical protein